MGETNFPRTFEIMTFVNVDCCRSRLRKCVGASLQLPSISIQICGVERSCRGCKIRLAIAIFLSSLPIYSSLRSIYLKAETRKREKNVALSVYSRNFHEQSLYVTKSEKCQSSCRTYRFPANCPIKVKFTISIRFFRWWDLWPWIICR